MTENGEGVIAMKTEMFGEYPDCVTVNDIKDMLHIGRTKVYDLLREGKIESVKVGQKYIVPKQCVIDFINISLRRH